MQYMITSRAGAREATRPVEAPNTAIISITDCGSQKNSFYQRSWIKGILELQINDEEAGGSGCVTEQQAREIAEFVLRVYKQVERFIVHCEFGQSRSAGVAAAMRTYFEGSSGGLFRSRKYCPNRTCYRLTLDALRKKGGISGLIRYIFS